MRCITLKLAVLAPEVDPVMETHAADVAEYESRRSSRSWRCTREGSGPGEAGAIGAGADGTGARKVLCFVTKTPAKTLLMKTFPNLQDNKSKTKLVVSFVSAQ
jgi:hypothetical protein